MGWSEVVLFEEEIMSFASLDTNYLLATPMKVATSTKRAQGSSSIRFHRRKSLACRKPNPKSAFWVAPKRSCYNEKKSVGQRMRILQRLIPGGRNIEAPEVLFHQTADYILKLRSQVQFLELLTNLYSQPGDHSLTVESCGSSGVDNL